MTVRRVCTALLISVIDHPRGDPISGKLVCKPTHGMAYNLDKPFTGPRGETNHGKEGVKHKPG